jgi:phosphotransferase system enzyme I (PtsI)
MIEFGQERALTGIAAAAGLVVGTILVERPPAACQRASGSPDQEMAAFRSALAEALAGIEAMVEAEDDLAGDILAFQAALLEDEDLLAAVFDAIVNGTAAQTAWSETLDREIADYRSGEDEAFSARADDLLDLKLRVLRALAEGPGESLLQPRAGDILVADDLTPSRFLELDWRLLGGAAIRGGSATSHVAILARARGVPLVVGLRAVLDQIPDGVQAVLDAEQGSLVLSPEPQTLGAVEGRLGARAEEAATAGRLADKPAVTADGEAVRVMINLDDPASLDALSPVFCDGIGLTRTEFLFKDGQLPGEEAQAQVYRKVVAWAAGRPVTIRSLDAGGDKPIAGVTPKGETNPFLGVRGLRLSLQHPEIFSVQLRALARAAAAGPLKIMVPMVTRPEEIVAVRSLLDKALAALAAAGVAHGRPELGMMVEVPAAALTAESFAVDFYSIGSNDLVQYTTASARDNAAVAALADPRNPAIAALIRACVAAAERRQVEVSLCGEMASDPQLLPLLLDCGLRCLSVTPAQLARVKLAISRYRREGSEGG